VHRNSNRNKNKNKNRIRMLAILAVAGCTAAALAAGSSAPYARATTTTTTTTTGTGTGALVSVAGPTGDFQRNLQANASLAVDPVHPHVLAATAYDLMETQTCSKQASITAAACELPATPAGGSSFNFGVGLTGIYFSFDSGHRWIQPTYHGLTAAGCDPTVEPCKAKPGPIHTVPNYYEHGLGSFGDSSVAFGPVLRDGKFSWANGSRLYVSSEVTNLAHTAIRPGSIDTNDTLAVSRIDNPTPARVADQSNWSDPVIVPKTAPAVSSPSEDQVWADNASSSRYFGNVYICYNDLYFENNSTPIYPTIAVSSDGGQTWTTHQIAAPIDSAGEGYRLGCAIRTDSHGQVYAVFAHFSGAFPSDTTPGSEDLFTSLNGGATWTKPADIMNMNSGCYYFDPASQRCEEEGPGGTPNEPGPSIDIANGAPSGAGATDEIALAWTDGRFGQNHEATLLSYSTDHARTWSAPVRVSRPGDRTVYSAVAIAPDASRIYVTYNGLTTPFTETTSAPHLVHGVLRSAVIGAGGAPAGWTTDYIGRTGDARGTGFAEYNYEEFLGFFVSAVATRGYGAGGWTDVSRTADCPAMDAWRETSLKADNIVTPAPWPVTDCPANFGNSDIWGATTAP